MCGAPLQGLCTLARTQLPPHNGRRDSGSFKRPMCTAHRLPATGHQLPASEVESQDPAFHPEKKGDAERQKGTMTKIRSLSPKPMSLFSLQDSPNLEQPNSRDQARQGWAQRGGAWELIPCQLLGVWQVGHFSRTALSQGEKADPPLLSTPENLGPPRSELLGSRRALRRRQCSLLPSAHASCSELAPGCPHRPSPVRDKGFYFSPLVCLPSPAVPVVAKTGSVRSAEESYRLNPKDTLRSPASSGGVSRRWSRCRELTCQAQSPRLWQVP